MCGFENHPERIYNIDETGVLLDPHPRKVAAHKREKKGMTSMLWQEITNHCSCMC